MPCFHALKGWTWGVFLFSGHWGEPGSTQFISSPLTHNKKMCLALCLSALTSLSHWRPGTHLYVESIQALAQFRYTFYYLQGIWTRGIMRYRHALNLFIFCKNLIPRNNKWCFLIMLEYLGIFFTYYIFLYIFLLSKQQKNLIPL